MIAQPYCTDYIASFVRPNMNFRKSSTIGRIKFNSLQTILEGSVNPFTEKLSGLIFSLDLRTGAYNEYVINEVQNILEGKF